MDERIWHRHYEEGVPASLEYEALSCPDFLRRSAEKHGDATAVIFMNCRLSYRELDEKVRRLATAMARLGVEPGSRVAIHLPNLPQTVIAYFAALVAGAEVVMTNPLYMPPEIEHQWNDAGCVLAVTADFLFDQKLRGLRDKLPVKHYLIASVPEYLRFPLNLLAPLKLKRQDPPLIAKVPDGPGIHRFKKLLEGTPPEPPRVERSLDDVAVLQYTGGTTGRSKGAMLTHRNLSVNVQQIDAWFTGVEYGQEVVLTCLPLFHVFGMTVAMNWGVCAAASLVLMPNPRDFDALVKNIAKHRVTLFPGVPALFNGLNNYPGIENIDVTSVKACFSGSAPIPVDVLERFEKLTGARITEGFGMSETSPVTHVNPLFGLRKVGCVGIPFPDTDARVVDIDTGERELPVGEEGELVVKGPQVMKGYWQRPEETAETLRADGWLHTGDLATMDEDGFFRIVGRKKDMILCSGYNVYPDEIDSVLMAHEAVLEAATIGVPDPKRGETVKSFIVLAEGKQATAAELEAYCRENLAAYKVPREVEFVSELPKSTVLKVLRRVLRDQEIEKRAAAGAS